MSNVVRDGPFDIMEGGWDFEKVRFLTTAKTFIVVNEVLQISLLFISCNFCSQYLPNIDWWTSRDIHIFSRGKFGILYHVTSLFW